MAQGEPTRKKFKHSIISERMFEPEFQEVFCRNWHGRTAFMNSEIEIIAEPFRVCKISNFLKSEEFMDELKNELIDVKTRRNITDLYQFEQSLDLVNTESTHVQTLYHTFETNLSDWMQKNTEIILNDTISMTSSCYSDTDYLLCHDDNVDDQRIAYILYLSKNWTEEDGGTLDLFDTDEDGLPRNVVKSIIPEYNALVFFEVVNNSFHQVSEVVSPDKSRWSISGWFDGPTVKSEKVQRPESVIQYIEPVYTEVDLSQWISMNYLYPGIMKDIQEDVEQESCTFLSDFFKDDVYEKLLEEVQSTDIKWKKVGPADVRHYEVADEETLPELFSEFVNIFKSITLFQLFKNYTDLDLVPETDTMNPKVTIELQRWSHGCYTLITNKRRKRQTNTVANADQQTAMAEANKSDYEAASGGESSSSTTDKLSRLQSDVEECEPTMAMRDEKSTSEDKSSNTPPSSQGDDEFEEEELTARCRPKETSLKKKKKRSAATDTADTTAAAAADTATTSAADADDVSQQLSPAETAAEPAATSSRKRRNSDTDHDSDVSDIGDYLSDPLEASYECSGAEEIDDDEEAEPAVALNRKSTEPGSLDVIMQFNTGHLEKETIDFVDVIEEDSALIHVPPKDNHLCMVYKTVGHTRVHRYVNHYVTGYFYNLICTYFE